MKRNKSFYSKILLFGEYSIIKDSMGLSIIYPLFEGHFSFGKVTPGHGKINVDMELKAVAKYLRQLKQKDLLLADLDVSSFEFDIGQGLCFKSSIPQGVGVGSSGALCAAILDRYGRDISPKDDILILKNILAQMESHFHGHSSGLDPLICYLNSSLLVKNKDTLGPVEIPDYSKGEGGIFLLNTGRPRRTEPLVNLFFEKCKDKSFAQLCNNVLLPITNGCITAFLNKDVNSLYEFYRELSDFQYRHFMPMIPQLYDDLWREGIESEKFYLKLCGAGGGGLLLGMTKNFEEAHRILRDYEIRPIFYF